MVKKMNMMLNSLNFFKKINFLSLGVALFIYGGNIPENQASATLADSLKQSSEGIDTESPPVEDPLEDFNRGIFQFNQVFDEYILHPIAQVYQAILPEPARESVHSFLTNLSSPIIFFNDVAQLEGDRAMDTLARFLINSTLGMGGLFDPAQELMEIPYHYEDFGQTLGTYGMGGGPYLVLPFLGPSNGRDTIGLGVDFLIDPIRYWARRNDVEYLNTIRYGIDAIDKRLEADNVLKRVNAAMDPYSFMRSIYTQNRDFNIQKGVVDLESPTPSED